MARKYVGVIDVCGKDGAGISTQIQTWNPKTWFIGYEQLGTYKGDMTGFKRGDKVKITYRESRGFWRDWFKPNIVKIEKISETSSNNGNAEAKK